MLFTEVPDISPRNRHQKGLYDIYIVSPARYRPGLDIGTVPAQEAPTTTDPKIAVQYRP